MPFNPRLYPASYPNLCPNTQLDTLDPIAELQGQILRLRSQNLLNTRRGGVSLAELQNQSLLVEQVVFRAGSPPPAPPPTPPAPSGIVAAPTPAPPAIAGVGVIYCGGGQRQQVRHGNVDKFVPATEQRSVVRWDLAIGRFRHAGLSSSARGYWCGGQNGFTVATNRTNNIEAIRFDFEQRLAVSATLTATRIYARGSESATKGYIVGNFNPNAGSVDGFTFATEAVAALGSALPQIVGGNNAFKNTSRAYFSSGWNQTRNIATITFNGEGMAVLAAQLSIVRIRGAAFQSATRGYVAAGASGTNGQTQSASVDGLRFSDDSTFVVARSLQVTSADIEGFPSRDKGYTFGGFRLQIAVNSFNFVGESWAKVRASLSQGGNYPVPVGRL